MDADGVASVYQTIMSRASVRRFQDRPVPRELVERLARAAQQAPFTGQMYSLVATADSEQRKALAVSFGPLVTRAPLFILVAVDFRKLEKFITFRGRRNVADDLGLLFLGIQDASYAAGNLVLAAEEAGLGSCYLGAAPFVADALIDLFDLPPRVYPLVGLVLGYPAEDPPARPRIPLEHCLFWDRYRDLDDAAVGAAMAVMDAGLLREGYYAKLSAKIPLPEGEPDGIDYDAYGWSEHVSRKYGVYGGQITAGLIRQLARQGIRLAPREPDDV